MLDIDHFKTVNDTYGHQVGDEVLARLSARVGQRLRASDSLARWGGEEFMALLPETGGEGAFRAAEDIREFIAGSDLPGPGRVTISLGVAVYEPGEALKDFTRRADAALYSAKESGRNRTVSA
jgi:diguanylate cyclase (GGDEF)-like protein